MENQYRQNIGQLWHWLNEPLPCWHHRHLPESTTTYTLLAAGPDGCRASDTITVRVVTTIYIPDVFTPNGDGVNDEWELLGLENYPNVEVTVWNRWGNAVFYGKGRRKDEQNRFAHWGLCLRHQNQRRRWLCV